MAELVSRDQNTDSEGQPLPAGEPSSPKEEDKAKNGHHTAGWVTALVLWALATQEKDTKVSSGTHKEQTSQESSGERLLTVLGFKTKHKFLSGDLNTCLFYVWNNQIPTSASHTQPWP